MHYTGPSKELDWEIPPASNNAIVKEYQSLNTGNDVDETKDLNRRPRIHTNRSGADFSYEHIQLSLNNYQ